MTGSAEKRSIGDLSKKRGRLPVALASDLHVSGRSIVYRVKSRRMYRLHPIPYTGSGSIGPTGSVLSEKNSVATIGDPSRMRGRLSVALVSNLKPNGENIVSQAKSPRIFRNVLEKYMAELGPVGVTSSELENKPAVSPNRRPAAGVDVECN
jgi:hypothetical protein